jgi:hypothetical protein
MKEMYYLDDLNTILNKKKDNTVFSYNFIERKWKENAFWFKKILLEGAVDCKEIKKDVADKIIKGEKYVIN